MSFSSNIQQRLSDAGHRRSCDAIPYLLRWGRPPKPPPKVSASLRRPRNESQTGIYSVRSWGCQLSEVNSHATASTKAVGRSLGSSSFKLRFKPRNTDNAWRSLQSVLKLPLTLRFLPTLVELDSRLNGAACGWNRSSPHSGRFLRKLCSNLRLLISRIRHRRTQKPTICAFMGRLSILIEDI